MTVGRDDPTPPGLPSRSPGRYHERAIEPERATPLPPPPVRAKTPLPVPWATPAPDNAPEPIDPESSVVAILRIENEEERVAAGVAREQRQLRLTSSPPAILTAKLDKGTATKALGLLFAGAVALYGAWRELGEKVEKLGDQVEDVGRDVDTLKVQVRELESNRPEKPERSP